MKRYFSAIIILCIAAFSANAQWRVASVQSSEPDTKLIQVIDAGSSTLVYATMTKECKEDHLCTLNNGTYVKAGGLKYKVLNSVNLPLGDDGDQRYAYLQAGHNEINFVMEFEKFPVADGFDIVEGSKDGEFCFNFRGVKVEPMDSTKVLDTKRFLDSASPVIAGKYAQDGSFFLYKLRNGVCVTCNAVTQEGEWFNKDELFYVDIVNDSSHGVMFDFDKVSVVGEKSKSGKTDTNAWTKYTPDSYDQYLEHLDYDQARYKSAGVLNLVGLQIDREKYWNTKPGTWERLGMDALSALNEQAIENRVNQYLDEHPADRPAALKSTSIKAGESVHGYIAAKKKKADSVTINIPMDGYDFDFTFTF